MPQQSLMMALTASIISAVFVGSIIFLASFKKSNSATSLSLRDLGLGLFLSSLVRIPTFLILAGIPLSSTIDGTAPYYALGLSAFIAAHALFFRGTVRFFTRSRFWINYVPFVFFLVSNLLVLASTEIFQLPLGLSIFEMAIMGSLNILFLTIANLRLICNDCSPRQRIGSRLLSVGWMTFFIAQGSMTLMVNQYPTDFWFFAITSSPTIFIYSAYTISYFVLFLGFFLRHTHTPKR